MNVIITDRSRVGMASSRIRILYRSVFSIVAFCFWLGTISVDANWQDEYTRCMESDFYDGLGMEVRLGSSL